MPVIIRLSCNDPYRNPATAREATLIVITGFRNAREDHRMKRKNDRRARVMRYNLYLALVALVPLLCIGSYAGLTSIPTPVVTATPTDPPTPTLPPHLDGTPLAKIDAQNAPQVASLAWM